MAKKELEEKKEKVAKKMLREEKSGVKEYSKIAKHTKGRAHKVYKSILPDEKRHVKKLKHLEEEE